MVPLLARAQRRAALSSTLNKEDQLDKKIELDEKPADLIAQYVTLRADMKIYDAQYAAAKKEAFDDPMNAIEMKLLDMLNKMGTQSLKAKTGTAYKKSFVSITTADPAEWRRHVIGIEGWDLVTFTPAKGAINDLIAEGGELPPGLNRTVTYKVHVNKPGEKEVTP
jgi:hypothetical protein